MRLKAFLKNNTPGNKPELWSDFLRAIWRTAGYHFRRIVIPSALDHYSQVIYDRDLKIKINLRDMTVRPIYIYGVREYATTKLLDWYLEAGMSIFDIGAHLGYYSLFAAKRVGSKGIIHAFEPNEEIYERLMLNICLNTISNVRAYKLAVSDKSGMVPFYVNLKREKTGLSSLQRPHDSTDHLKKMFVSSTTLDHFLGEYGINKVDLMKVDVEGCEDMVFKGAEALLKGKNAPDIIFECHEGSDAMGYLEALYYGVYDIWFQGGRVPVLSQHGRYPLDTIYRSYEAPNFFATKRLKSKLERLVI